MNKMRLTRDKKWFFQNYPYYQLRMDNDLLHGWVALNYLTDGEPIYWEYDIAGKVQVCGKGMTWLTILPDNRKRCIGAYILPGSQEKSIVAHNLSSAQEKSIVAHNLSSAQEKSIVAHNLSSAQEKSIAAHNLPGVQEKSAAAHNLPNAQSRSIHEDDQPVRRVSTWYIDVIEDIGKDEDGVLYYIDKYLDVMLTPQGDVCIKDRDELDAAYASGELTKEQYDAALYEGEQIVKDTADISKFEKYCLDILDLAEKEIEQDKFTVFLDIDGVMDVYSPNKAIQELLPSAISCLSSFVERTDAEIVIISDWRYGAPQYREKALKLGFEQKVALWDELTAVFDRNKISIKDVSPWNDECKSRTEEIKKYLKSHPNIKRYVIFDDCYGDDYTSDATIHAHLVFVDALKGLQVKDLLEGCRIMNTCR